MVANEPVADIMAAVHDGHVKILMAKNGIAEAAGEHIEH